MPNIIETRRLLLRPFELIDAEAAHEWFGDPLVMKYTPTGADGSVEKTRDRVRTYQAHQTAHGFSKWLIADRESGKPIGDAGSFFCRSRGGSSWDSVFCHLAGAKGWPRRRDGHGCLPPALSTFRVSVLSSSLRTRLPFASWKSSVSDWNAGAPSWG